MKIGIVIGPWGYSLEQTIATMRTTEERGFNSWHMGDHFFSVNQIDSIEPYLLLAMAGKVSSDLQAIVLQRPQLFADLIRELRDAPDHAILRVAREIRDGDW